MADSGDVRVVTRTVRTVTPHSRWLTAALVLVVAIVACAQWWRINATPFPQVSVVATTPVRASVGEPHHHRALPVLPAVEVHRADVVLAPGSPPAATAVSVCQREPEDDLFGSATGDLSRFCRRITPLAGQDLSALREAPDLEAYLVVTVVPLAPGELRVEGVDVSFSDGFRRGHQRTGAAVVLDVSR